MKKYFELLKNCPLFANIEEKELQALLTCLNVKERKIQRGEILFPAGEQPQYIGVVLSGRIYIVQEDYWGNRTILAAVEAGGLFGEAFACAQAEVLPVSVTVHQEGKVLLIDCQKILSTCSASCEFHTALIRNLMQALASKNIALTRKIKHITKKTTREKVLSYLSECAILNGSQAFDIPFNRQELADYLSVERSALSNTLCKMRDEGLIAFHKNKFRLL